MTTLQPDYIFSGQFLLPEGSQSGVIKNGGLAVGGDTIFGVDSLEALRAAFPRTPVIKEKCGLIMPGLVNTHTHAAMSCFRGLADDLPLMTWLEQHIFPIEAKLTADMVYQSSLLSIAEMIRSGTTSFCDMYLFSNEVARAAAETGIRSWIGEVLYDFPSPCYGEVESGILFLQDLIAEYSSHPLVTITTDPHSVYTCSPDLLVQLGNIARDNDTLYVIHLSENDAEVNTCLERYGCRPVEHLDKLGLLGPSTLASHLVKINENDLQLLQKHQVKAAHCAASNMKLASGIAPVVEMLKKGITLSLGTDGSASNNAVDMFSEMNSVAKLHKVICSDPTVMTAEETVTAATLGGAEALGAEKLIGTLAVGKQADFIVLDLDQPHMVPLYNIPSQLTYVARGGDVLHSFVAGKQIMKNRELLTLDEAQLLNNMREMSQKIIQLRNHV